MNVDVTVVASDNCVVPRVRSCRALIVNSSQSTCQIVQSNTSGIRLRNVPFHLEFIGEKRTISSRRNASPGGTIFSIIIDR